MFSITGPTRCMLLLNAGIGIKMESKEPEIISEWKRADGAKAVSYTHLTLPTIYSV